MSLTDLNRWAEVWTPLMKRACWQGALAVAIVWGLCRLFPRLPAGLRAGLWWLVCFKTLLGLGMTGPLSVAMLPAAPVSVSPALQTMTLGSPELTALPLTDSPLDVAKSIVAAGQPLPSESLSLASLALCFWSVGVLFFLFLLGRSLWAIRRLVAQARPCDEGLAIQDVARAVGLPSAPPVLVSESAEGSLVVGPWCPRVVLCRADLIRLSARERCALLAHELAHIHRRDLWAGVVPNLVRLLFFFNPLVWLACREYDLAREAACDAEALRVSGLAPADYGRLLLKLSTPSRARSQYVGMATLGAASPFGILLRRRLHGLQRLGQGVHELSRWRAGGVLLITISALSLNPVRIVAKPAPDLLSPKHDLTAHTSRRPAILPVQQPPLFTLIFTLPTMLPSVPKPSLISLSPTYLKKVDQPMFTFKNVQKPTLSAALATAALAAATPTLFVALPTVAQEAPPVPVAPPVAPSPPTIEFKESVAQAPRYQYTLRRGESYSTHSRDKAVATAQHELAKAQPGDCLVVDRDGKRFLITDAATLKRIQENYATVEAISKQMEAKGKQMEEAAKPMEALGKQMEELGKQMEVFGKQMEEQGRLLEVSVEAGKKDADQKAIHEQMRLLQEKMRGPQTEMRALAEKMRAESGKMRPVGDQMREHGKQIRAAVKEAEARVTETLDSAFKNNLAVEQKAS